MSAVHEAPVCVCGRGTHPTLRPSSQLLFEDGLCGTFEATLKLLLVAVVRIFQGSNYSLVQLKLVHCSASEPCLSLRAGLRARSGGSGGRLLRIRSPGPPAGASSGACTPK